MKTIEKIRLCLFAGFGCTKRFFRACPLAVIIAPGICLGLMAISFILHQAGAAENTGQFSNPDSSFSAPETAGDRLPARLRPAVAPHPKWANFNRERKSEDARHLADWVVDSGDHHGMPFAILDKIEARVFVFDPDGRLCGAAPALLGLGKGDDLSPGIGDKKLSEIRPEDRITPAGRFVSSLGFNYYGKDILWVDYDSATSLHRVVTGNPKERRLERLASPKPLEHRISFGCINVPAKFFDDVVKPAFTGTYGIVYVLPETRSINETFKSYYDVELRWGTRTTTNIDEHPRPGSRQEDLRFGRP